MPLQTDFHPLRRLVASLLCTTLLYALLAASGETSETAAAPAAASEPFELVIVHANDTHAYAAGMTERGAPCDADEACLGGYARIAAKIKSEKAAHPHVLALDAGDRWQGTLFFRTGGEVFIGRATNAIPWDALTLGNHEFDLGVDVLAEHLKRSTHPTLAANIAPQSGERARQIAAHRFCTRSPFRIRRRQSGRFRTCQQRRRLLCGACRRDGREPRFS